MGFGVGGGIAGLEQGNCKGKSENNRKSKSENGVGRNGSECLGYVGTFGVLRLRCAALRMTGGRGGGEEKTDDRLLWIKRIGPSTSGRILAGEILWGGL